MYQVTFYQKIINCQKNMIPLLLNYLNNVEANVAAERQKKQHID